MQYLKKYISQCFNYVFDLQMANKELLELQSELEILKEENKKAEVDLLTQQGISRVKVCCHRHWFEHRDHG